MSGWVDRIYRFDVERRLLPRPGGAPLRPLASDALVGVLHTTEGGTVDSAVSVLREKFSGPHFVIGQNRIVQTRPLDRQGAALKTVGSWFPNAYCIQIEMVADTPGNASKPWLPPDETLEPTAAVLAYLAEHKGIPLRRPEAWPDTLQSAIWAVTSNPRRKQKLYPHGFRGWFMHLEVPQNDHYDCGSLKWATVLERARAFLEGGLPADPEERALKEAELELTEQQAMTLAWLQGYLSGKRDALEGKDGPEAPNTGPYARIGFAEARAALAWHRRAAGVDVDRATAVDPWDVRPWEPGP